MRLQDELFKSADGWTGARYTVAVQGGGYFQGVKAVGDFSPQSVTLYFSKACLLVQGERLTIAKYADGDVELRGAIHSIAIQDKE
jgi:hypothetical protein